MSNERSCLRGDSRPCAGTSVALRLGERLASSGWGPGCRTAPQHAPGAPRGRTPWCITWVCMFLRTHLGRLCTDDREPLPRAGRHEAKGSTARWIFPAALGGGAVPIPILQREHRRRQVRRLAPGLREMQVPLSTLAVYISDTLAIFRVVTPQLSFFLKI